MAQRWEKSRGIWLADEAGRGVGAGDVFGAMRSPIVNPPSFDLIQLDVAGSIRIIALLDPRKRLITPIVLRLVDR